MSEHETDEQASAKRRMPDNLRRYLLKMQGGKIYLPAAYRIVWFRDEMGDDWGIATELIEGGHESGFGTVKASILDPNGMVKASAHKTESKADFPAGWVEKAETGAVARALAFLGFGTQFSAELDEDGNRPADSPQPVRPVSPPPVRTSVADIKPTNRSDAAKEEIAAYKAECRKLLEYADMAEHAKTVRAMRALCETIRPGLIEAQPDIAQWGPACWRSFRDAINEHTNKGMAVA